MIMQELVPLSAISGLHEYRKDHGDIAALAADIGRAGLVCPVILTEDRRIISGSRRVMAAQLRGVPTIAALVIDTLAEAFAALESEKVTTIAYDSPHTLPLTSVEWVHLQRVLTNLRTGSKTVGFKLSERIARYCGVSTNTLWRAAYVVEAANRPDAPPESAGIMQEMADTGNVTRAYEKIRNPGMELLTNREFPTITDLKTQRTVLQGASAKMYGLVSVLPQIREINPRMTQEELQQFITDMEAGQRVLAKTLKTLRKAQK